MGWFDKLKLDAWYKAMTYLGGVIILLSLTIPIRILSNEVTAVIGSGLFLYGVGRWKNVKTHSNPTPGGIITWQDRNPDLGGLILEALGILAIVLAVGYAINSNFQII